MTHKTEIAAKLRALADSIEQTTDMAIHVGWSTPDGRLAVITYGHQVIADALIVHMLRVSIKHGAIQLEETTQ